VFADVAPRWLDFVSDSVLVAHNAPFDTSFLNHEISRVYPGHRMVNQHLCTVKLSRRLFPQFRTHKLGDLIARHGLRAPARHRAYDDADCLWQFYQLCLAEFDLDTVEAAVRMQLGAFMVESQI